MENFLKDRQVTNLLTPNHNYSLDSWIEEKEKVEKLQVPWTKYFQILSNGISEIEIPFYEGKGKILICDSLFEKHNFTLKLYGKGKIKINSKEYIVNNEEYGINISFSNRRKKKSWLYFDGDIGFFSYDHST